MNKLRNHNPKDFVDYYISDAVLKEIRRTLKLASICVMGMPAKFFGERDNEKSR